MSFMASMYNSHVGQLSNMKRRVTLRVRLIPSQKKIQRNFSLVLYAENYFSQNPL